MSILKNKQYGVPYEPKLTRARQQSALDGSRLVGLKSVEQLEPYVPLFGINLHYCIVFWHQFALKLFLFTYRSTSIFMLFDLLRMSSGGLDNTYRYSK